MPTTIGWFRTPPGMFREGHRRHPAVKQEPMPDQTPTVLLSGAGFSIPWGLPSTGQLVDRIETLHLGNPDVQQMMAEPMGKMLGYARKAKGDAFDIEDLTTRLVEYGLADDVGWWEKLGFPKEDQPMEDAEFFYRHLLWSFAYVLLASDPWSAAFGPGHGAPAPSPYADLEMRYGGLAGVISLNYDVIPEHLFSNRGLDYGFRKRDLLIGRDMSPVIVDLREMHRRNNDLLGDAALPPEVLERISDFLVHNIAADHVFEPRPFPVLKVHGGMNMAYCPECERSIVMPPWLRVVGKKQWDYPGYEFGWARCGGHTAAFHCARATGEVPPNMEQGRLQPLAIPPVKNKEDLPQWQVMAPVHGAALRLAADAERLLVIGTSMRPADQILWDIVAAAPGEVQFIGSEGAFKDLAKRVPRAQRIASRLE